MFRAQVLYLAVLAATGVVAQQCAGTACIVTTPCGQPSNETQWTLANKTIDGLVATNIISKESVPAHPGFPVQNTVNCPGQDQGCHSWGSGFNDRNGFFLLDGDSSSFVVRSWPSNGSIPVTPGQIPADLCLTSEAVADGGADQPKADGSVVMVPCDSSKALKMALDAETGQIHILSKVPIANPLCLGAPLPPPAPPPGRPNHYYSCTAGLRGGPRLPYPFCNSSLPEDERLDDLIARATCDEKSAAVTSSGAAIRRLGVPLLGSAEDTHGVGGGCIPATELPTNSTSTGCPTTFPAGPGMGASFDRSLWRSIGAAIGLEARGLNNARVGPLYFLDPDINLLRYGRVPYLSTIY
jgi:hypothetical protein